MSQNPRQTRIIQIAAVAVPGERRTFVNVYGLDEQSHVWQWNAKEARWRPHKLEARSSNNNGRSPNDGRRSDDAPF